MNKTTLNNLIQSIEEINNNLPLILEKATTVKRSITDLKRFERTNNIELSIDYETMLNDAELQLFFISDLFDNYDNMKEEFIRDPENKTIINDDLIFTVCQLEDGNLEEIKDIKRISKDIIKTLQKL